MAGNAKDLQADFWKAIHGDRTVMLACEGVYPRPMTALAENDSGPLWFFTARANDLAAAVARKPRAGLLMLASKGLELFATAGGTLSMDNDRAVIDRLWNPWVAAWYEEGKDDPELRLLRFDPDAAEIWRNENSLWAGLKMMVGVDPKQSFEDDVATVKLRGGRGGGARKKR